MPLHSSAACPTLPVLWDADTGAPHYPDTRGPVRGQLHFKYAEPEGWLIDQVQVTGTVTVFSNHTTRPCSFAGMASHQ